MNILKKIEITVDEFRSTMLLLTDDGLCIQAEKGSTDHDWWFGKPFRVIELTETEHQNIIAAMRSCHWQAREYTFKS